jgi:hypothetical protein
MNRRRMLMKYVLLIGWLLTVTPLMYGAEHSTAPAHPTASSAAEPTAGFAGKVVETTNAPGYTYVLVDTGKKKLWAAAPQFVVKVGDTVAIGDGMPMANYHSKTLNRDFDMVYFTGSVTVNGVRPAPPAASAPAATAELPKNHPPIGGAPSPAKVDLSGIKKAPGGWTVAEVYADQAKLNGQQVTVRGKVVKFNSMIMGKNWVHIRDGSGTEGTNDLLLTTDAEAKVGDTILVTGTVATNKDFGANYKYAVLVEQAKLKVE